MFKPAHGQEREKILRRMSTMSPLSVSQPVDPFLGNGSSFQTQHEQKHQHNYRYPQQQQQRNVSSLLPGSIVIGEQSVQQLGGHEIEDSYTSWISDVLDDFPAITREAELPPLVSPSNANFDRGPILQVPVSTQQPPYTALQSSSGTRSRTARPPESKSTVPPTTSVRKWSSGVKIPKAPGLRGRHVSYNLLESNATALEPFNPRGSAPCRHHLVSGKSKKPSRGETLDHVQRERQRRNDMSFKIWTLEGLLPPLGPNLKRDRAAIVHDTGQYLQFLQARVQKLRGTLAEMKLKVSTSGGKRQTAVLKIGKPVLPRSSHGKSKLVEYFIQVEGDGEQPLRLEKCRCRSDFMSSAMKILEHLNLDVCRCTVTKVFDYTICVIIAKPHVTASSQVASSASVVSAFRSSLWLS